jgi:hypothetical protein
MTVKSYVRAGLVAAALLAAPVAIVPGAAQAQMHLPTAEEISSFDAYRALAITVGVVAGSAVAVIVTDGLIIPVYGAVTGAGSSVLSTVTGGAIGGGGGAAAVAGEGYGLLAGAFRLLGAVTGGLIADSWYMNR